MAGGDKKQKRRFSASFSGILVPRMGLEPTSPLGHYHLKVACLPIPPPRYRILSAGCRWSAEPAQLAEFAPFSVRSELSHSLPLLVLLLLILPSARLMMKNSAARMPVIRVMKLPEPLDPNSVPEAPAPKEAPISAPLPCCSITRPTRPIATIKENNQKSFVHNQPVPCGFAAYQVLRPIKRDVLTFPLKRV